MAEVDAQGKVLEAKEDREAKGLAIILEDVQKEVWHLRQKCAAQYVAEFPSQQDILGQLHELKQQMRAMAREQERLIQLLDGSSTAAYQVAAQGVNKSLSEMERGVLQQPRQLLSRVSSPPLRLGLVTGFLYKLDVMALQFLLNKQSSL